MKMALSPGAETFGHRSNRCQMCKSKETFLVLDLGLQPHSDFFPTTEQLNDAEILYPLRLYSCVSCGLLQIDYFVNPRDLYQKDYLYQSSTTKTGKKHYVGLARAIKKQFSIPTGSLAVDIGSNVGVLLQGFKDAGLSVLGVDPAFNIAQIAIKNGIETIVEFFDRGIARDIRKRHGAASVITGTNVFAHLHALDDAVWGMKDLLADEGVLVIEAPHALEMMKHLEYDTVYLEHIGYLSARPMQSYFARMGLELFDVQKFSIHGGSLRYFIGHVGKHEISERLAACIAEEEREGLYSRKRLQRFASDVELQKLRLVDLILNLKKKGKRIVALSAPAKGNTLLNFCHLDRSFLEYATERNMLKIGRYTPGMHLPIFSDRKIMEDMPDYALLLAWNFADEIMANMSEYRKKGGKFIIPIPKPHIL